jgi:hypothetical protein
MAVSLPSHEVEYPALLSGELKSVAGNDFVIDLVRLIISYISNIPQLFESIDLPPSFEGRWTYVLHMHTVASHKTLFCV